MVRSNYVWQSFWSPWSAISPVQDTWLRWQAGKVRCSVRKMQKSKFTGETTNSFSVCQGNDLQIGSTATWCLLLYPPNGCVQGSSWAAWDPCWHEDCHLLLWVARRGVEGGAAQLSVSAKFQWVSSCYSGCAGVGSDSKGLGCSCLFLLSYSWDQKGG